MNIGSPLVISSGIVLNDYFRFINFQAKFYLGGVKYQFAFVWVNGANGAFASQVMVGTAES